MTWSNERPSPTSKQQATSSLTFSCFKKQVRPTSLVFSSNTKAERSTCSSPYMLNSPLFSPAWDKVKGTSFHIQRTGTQQDSSYLQIPLCKFQNLLWNTPVLAFPNRDVVRGKMQKPPCPPKHFRIYARNLKSQISSQSHATNKIIFSSEKWSFKNLIRTENCDTLFLQ